MSNLITITTLLLLTLIIILSLSTTPPALAGVKRRIHISDDLDDVVDDEEDEKWRLWGRKSEFDPPPSDFSAGMKDEMMKRHVGPVFGFVKLRLGVRRRTPDMVSEIAMKWTKLSRTGAIETQFMGVDLSTIMFTMEKGQDSFQLKDFVLNQPEAYEIKMGDQVFRRSGDPPLEELIEKLQMEKNKREISGVNMENEQGRDEL